MIKLIDRGNKQDGLNFSIHFPELVRESYKSVFCKFHRLGITLPTKIIIDSSAEKCYIECRLLGFGISLSIWSYYDAKK